MTKLPTIVDGTEPGGDRGGFHLTGILPWGRNRAEYTAFFDLAELRLGIAVLDCAAGPSSFAVEMADRGFRVVAADPVYSATKDEIAAQIEASRALVMESLRASARRFVWDSYRSPEGLEATRLTTMKHFLEDFGDGVEAGRYVATALPRLPFADGAFDLALCSHFLLLYSAQFDGSFHKAAVGELCRVARELRIFPILDLQGVPSRHLPAVGRVLSELGWSSELRRVGYEFQKGGNQMLHAWRPGKAGRR